MHDLGPHFERLILESTGAESFEVREVIQELWSGYGKILRIRLTGGNASTVVVKHVRMPVAARHPRGWNSSLSHERKVKSYEVETNWYRDWSHRCGITCRLPKCLALQRHDEDVLIVLEDLDASGFPARLGHVGWRQIEICLEWLADFHATFMSQKPSGLWDIGTYWHLNTRPEELKALDDTHLKSAAKAIDARLNQATFQTFVHGDAKLANFCFSEDSDQVAAVDYQYVGGGCGMKDVAYFVGSCLDEASCKGQEAQLLECYFSALRRSLSHHHPDIDADAVITEWEPLYHWAWTDFHRFLKGWSPGHWKINSYSERLTKKVLAELAQV